MATLVTGGTGFVGLQVVRALLAANGQRLVAFDVNPAADRLDDVRDHVELVRGDLGIFSHVLDAVRRVKPEVIYHLGGMLSLPAEADPAGAMRANVLGTFHVLEAARLFAVPRVIFSSTLATYGFDIDIDVDVIDDTTLQRPQLFYGATKVFGENIGRFYRRKHGLDFRGIRFPAIVGPGVRTVGITRYTSHMIEAAAAGKPYSVYVEPETRCQVMYYKDAAQALVQLADAPSAAIKTVTYNLAGITPSPSAEDIARQVHSRVPGARIAFAPDFELQAILNKSLLPIDERSAVNEWGWHCAYDLERLVEDFLDTIKRQPNCA